MKRLAFGVMFGMGLICALATISHAQEAPAATATAMAGDPPVRLRLLAMPAVNQRRIDADLADSVLSLVVAELSRRPQFEVLTMADLNAIVARERLKDLMGCDEVSCSYELGGALGAERLLVMKLGAIGDQYLFELSLLDVENSAPLARLTKQVAGGETALPAAVQASVAELLNETQAADQAALARKRQPTFFTVELQLGPAFRDGSEPYSRQFTGAIAIALGGRHRPSGLYFHALAGIEVSHFRGDTDTAPNGAQSYQRTALTPFAEARVQLPLTAFPHLRLMGHAGLGLNVESYNLEQKQGLNPHGSRRFWELRMGGGAWYRLTGDQSVFGGYHYRLQRMGDGADPLSETRVLGSTPANVSVRAVTLGWAYHF